MCFCINANAQVAFQKIFGGVNIDSSSCVQQTTDGGYIIVGTTSSFGSGLKDIYLIKTNVDADTLWTKTYGELGNWNEVGLFVQQTTDTGYIITGYTDISNPSHNTCLIKTDANGNLVWAKKFGSLLGGYSEGKCVKQTSDSGYIITGYIKDTSVSNGTGIFLLKTDSNGTIQWKKVLFDSSGNEDGLSLAITADGSYIITGYTYSYGAGGADVCLIKTDNNGTVLWAKTYGGVNDDIGNSVQQTTDGGYIITGKTESFGSSGSDVYLIKTDSSGVSLWTKTYGGTSADFGYSVKQTIDGGYIVIGSTYSFGAGNYDVYLIKTNSTGVIVWTKSFGTVSYEHGYFVQQTIDSGYIIVGIMNPINPDVYLIKTDANGNSGCNQGSPMSISNSVVSIATSLSIVSSAQSGTTGVCTPILGSGGTTTTSCFSTSISETTSNMIFNIYPNPAQSQITIEFDLAETKNTFIEIKNILGQTIKTISNYAFVRGNNKIEIDISEFSKGLYFVQLQSENRITSKKIIKE